MQNILACLLFAPVLLGAHLSGFENVALAMQAAVGSQPAYLLILTLCVQMALRSLRVALIWSQMLFFYYFSNDTLLSISNPHQSFWSFVMLCGLMLAGLAVVADRRSDDRSYSKAGMNGSLEVPA